MTPEELASKMRQGTERFRILIIGNANAGKTTILEKVCNAKGRSPEFLDAEGEKIDSELKSSVERGEHDVETQIVYPTARGFIFHDSRGFEAGACDELQKVREFVSKRAKREQMKDQLHAIWYCLPTSNDRPLTKAEMSLFESGTGNVPVIAIFTKMDALDKKVFSEQLNKGVPIQEARKKIPSLAKAKFERDYLGPLSKVSYPPRYTVQLRNMNKPNTDCDELLKNTARALDSKTQKLLLLSAQRNNADLCIEQVVKEIIIPHAQKALEQQSFSQEQQKSLFRDVMVCFPHALPSFDRITYDMSDNARYASNEITAKSEFSLRRESLGFGFLLESRRESLGFLLEFRFLELRDERDEDYLSEYFDALSQVVPPLVASPQCQVFSLGTAIMVIMTYSLFGSSSSPLIDFQSALAVYMESPSSELITTLEESFQTCHSVTEVDASKLYDIVIANPLIAACLHH